LTDTSTLTDTDTYTSTDTVTDTLTTTSTETTTNTETVILINISTDTDTVTDTTVEPGPDTPLDLVVRNGSGTVTDVGTVYEVDIETASVADVTFVCDAWNSITVEDMTDGVILGGAGDIVFITFSGDGFILFDDTTNTIQTTSGDIIMIAGSGGITAGNILSGSNNQPEPTGLIRLLTINGGDISTGYLNALGSQSTSVSVISAGDLTIVGDSSHGAVKSLMASTADEPDTSTSEICLLAAGDIDIDGKVEAVSHGKTATVARIHICADGTVTIDVGSGRVKANASTAEGGTAIAEVLIHSGASNGITITGPTKTVEAHANAGSGNKADLDTRFSTGTYTATDTDTGASAYIEIIDNWLGGCPDCPRPDTATDTATITCLLYTSPSPRDATLSRMPSSA